MDNVISIERAVMQDAEILQEIQRKAFLPDLEMYGESPGDESVESIVYKIGRYDYYKVLYNGSIVGGFNIGNKGNGIYRLKRIYLDPDVQNKGIGSVILKKLDELYPDAVKWMLDTPFRNYRNQHFYEKFGFRKIFEHKINDLILFEYERIIENRE